MLLFNDTVFCHACIVLMLVADDGISDKIGPIVQLVCMTVNIGVHMVESVRVRVQCECRVLGSECSVLNCVVSACVACEDRVSRQSEEDRETR